MRPDDLCYDPQGGRKAEMPTLAPSAEAIERGVRLFTFLADTANDGEALGISYSDFMAYLHGLRSFRELAGREYVREDTTEVLAAALRVTAKAGGRKKVTRGAHSIDAGMDTFIWSSRPPFDRPAAAWTGRLRIPYSRLDWLAIFPDEARRLVSIADLDEKVGFQIPALESTGPSQVADPQREEFRGRPLVKPTASETLGGVPERERESREQLDRMQAMLEDIRRAHTETFHRQEAVIRALARVVENMEATDRCICEQTLLGILSHTWAKLTPTVRSLLMASEQMYRTPGFAAPAKVIDGLATAFERQLQHSIVSPLFKYLKDRGVTVLRALPDWQDAEQRGTPLWAPSLKAEKCVLGTTKLILRHPEPAIAAFFNEFGLDRSAVRGALDAVYAHRNAAVHGSCFDLGTVASVRTDWLSWNHRVGGIYSVLFKA